MKKSICIYIFLPVILSMLSPLMAAEMPDIENLTAQISAVEKQLSQTGDTNEYEKLKSQTNSILNQLKACEVNLSAEIDRLVKIQTSVTPKTDISSTSELKNVKLTEARLNGQLLECKYLALKTSQLRDELLDLLSNRQISDYLTANRIYASNASSLPVTFGSNAAQKIYLFFSGYILLLILAVRFVISRTRNKPKLTAMSGVLATLACSFIAVFIANTDHLLISNGTWLFWCSFLVLGRILAYENESSSLFQSVVAGLAITTSTLLVDPIIWETEAYLHGSIIFLALSAFYLLTSRGRSRKGKTLTVLTLLPVVILETLEYHAAGHQLLIVYFVILVLLSFHQIASRFFDSVLLSFFTSDFSLLKKIREKLGVEVGVEIPGINWIRMTFYVSVMSLSFLSLVNYSGLPSAFIERLQQSFYEGFYVGTVLINVKNLLVATLIFGFLVVIAWVIKQRIEKGETHESNQQVGSQTAKAALFWYSAILTAFLVALSVSGISVQNLALIAGAFSVGIGFGLQNIVSNFVSGIILLIERPVKPGDWVIIGSTEGLVQKISIRATQVRTFDKADILIPNSELITNQVTNLMLSDHIGRLKLAIGVAYGSDTNKVMSILKSLVNNHPEIITNDINLEPSVIFMRFGDSSLDFEVRCFLRDIKLINTVRSQLNMAIDNQFRENDIEIPFPQRDLHVRSWDIKNKGNHKPDSDSSPNGHPKP